MSEETNLNEDGEATGTEGEGSKIEGRQKREKRPRINHQEKIAGASKIEDEFELEYKPNKCTQRGRHIEDIRQSLIINFWHHEHYIDRYSKGENDGTPRRGIEPDKIRDLVILSMRHLLYYSAVVPDFAFVNEGGNKYVSDDNRYRVIIQRDDDGVMLNVPIEVHFDDFFKYEVTVTTAMKENGFRIKDGQYILELLGEYDSILKKLVKNRVIELHTKTT